jgi:rod shape-determining protein MreD
MPVSTDRAVEVFRVHPATLWVSAFVALLLQTFLPLKLPMARLLDFPLLVAIYFPLVRRNKVFGIGLGTGLGLLQDALSHGFIGISGMAKALVGYLAASASMRFELESLLARSVMTSIFVLIHSLTLAGLQHGLLESPPPFQPLEMASGILVNVALGLVTFQVLDKFRHPA